MQIKRKKWSFRGNPTSASINYYINMTEGN